MAAKRMKKVAAEEGRQGAVKANLVVNSKVKEAIKGHGVRMAGDFGEALNARVSGIIKDAVGRCQANNRGTVRPQDL